MNILIFIVILALLVLVHEFGHFIVAKKSGIRVDEFGLGFPPKIFGKKFGETEYTLNAIPFGGFVKIYGENPTDGELDPKQIACSLAHKSKWIQAAVLAAGVTFNIIFAWLLISIGLMYGLPTAADTTATGGIRDSHVFITSVLPNSPAEEGGLKNGDEIVSVQSGGIVLNQTLTPTEIHNLIVSSTNPIEITYKRASQTSKTNITTRTGIIEESPAIGISMDLVGISTEKLPIHKAFIHGAVMTWQLLKMIATHIVYFLYESVSGHADLSQVSGPIGMISMVGDQRELGFAYLIFFTALLSINLAVINLIPFPALDGGRLFILLIEAIKRSPLKPKFVNALNITGFTLLIILMLVVTGHDILIKLF
ncbi:MAG: hypothetical protein EXS46_02385 [Candidatus Taylorbacteria bacterium]|nr:hypothetical protein [Candidatus Taylorbacteria bacterium]